MPIDEIVRIRTIMQWDVAVVCTRRAGVNWRKQAPLREYEPAV